MRKKPHVLRKPRQKRGQAARVVVVPVRKDDIRHAGKIDSHACGVFEEHVRIARVEQDALLPILDEIAHRRLAEIIAVDIRVVVHQYR